MTNPAATYFEDVAATGMTCPHPDAFEPDGVRVYYRVLKTNSVDSDCFLPTPLRADKPIPKDCDACVQKSVSIYDDLPGMINGYFRTPAGRGKKKHVGVLILQGYDGMLKRTFGPSHHSWWRSSVFDTTTVTIQEIQL